MNIHQKKHHQRFLKIAWVCVAVAVLSVAFGIYMYMRNQTVRMNATMDFQSSGDGYDAAGGNFRQNEFLKLKEEYNFDLESCDIVHLFSSDLSSFVIKKGKNSGIELDDPVITERGEVVGRVTKLGKNWAIVSTVWKAGMYIDGNVADTDIRGMIVGKNKLLRKNPPIFSTLDGDFDIFAGDEILTYDVYRGFPANLLIGTVTYVYVASDGKMGYSLIKPAFYHDGTPFDQVLVVKDFDVPPSEY